MPMGLNIVVLVQKNPIGIIFDSFSSLNLYQMNACTNDFDSTLDLIFTYNKDLTVNLSYQNLVTIDRYHPSLKLDLNLNYNNVHICSPPYLDFKRTDYGTFNKYLNNIDWSIMYNFNEIDATIEHFYNIIQKGIHLFVKKKIPINNYFPSWFSNKLRNLIFFKKKQHKLYKSTNNPLYYETFSKLRSRCKLLSKQCYTNYLNNIQSNFINNPKHFWKYIKDKKQYNVLPNNMHLNGHYSDDIKTITNNFKSSFASTYSSHTQTNLVSPFIPITNVTTLLVVVVY